MKKVTLQEMEDNFDEYFEDCINNKEEYTILLEDGNSVVMTPLEEENG